MNLKLNSDVTRKKYSIMISDTEIYKKLNIVLTYDVEIKIIDAIISELRHLLASITKSDELSIRITNNLREELLDYLSVIVLNIFIVIKNYGIDKPKNLSVVDTFIKYEEEITEYFNDGISYFYKEILENNEELHNIIDKIGAEEHASKVDEINDIIIDLIDSITDIYTLVER